MPKQKRFRAIEWIKEQTPRWSLLHTVLDAVVGEIIRGAGLFALFLASLVITILSETLSTISLLLLFFFLVGTIMSGVRLWGQSKSLRAISKPERRLAELIDEAEDVRDAKSAATWLKGVCSFFAMVGDQELAQQFGNQENLLRFMKDVEENDGDDLKDAVNVLKNYAATQMQSDD